MPGNTDMAPRTAFLRGAPAVDVGHRGQSVHGAMADRRDVGEPTGTGQSPWATVSLRLSVCEYAWSAGALPVELPTLGDVHVWRIDLKMANSRLEHGVGTLSPD